MPQSSDELRAYWGGIEEGPAMNHLQTQGFKLTRKWEWVKPAAYEMTERDWKAIQFLVEEWDFDGLVPAA